MGRRKAKTALITFLITFIVVSAIAGFICFKIASEKDAQIALLEEQKADAKCYAFSRDLRAGAIITQNDLKELEIKDISKASGMYMIREGAWKDENGISHKYATRYVMNGDKKSEMAVLIDYEIVGRKVKSNVSANTPILDSLLYSKDGEDAIDVRIEELNINFLAIPWDLYIGDYCDVRIQFPEGQDYLVLAGKYVEGLGVDVTGNPTSDSIYTKINVEELMLLGSAIIEAYMQSGVRLYATKYSDPATQLYKESIVDYVALYEAGLAKARLVKEYEIIAERATASGDFYLTLDNYLTMSDEEKTSWRNIVGGVSVNDEDITNAEIAVYAGFAEDYVKLIREAKEGKVENAEDILNYYRVMRVQTRKDMEISYAVKDEVLAVVRANPNLVDTIKNEFDIRAVAITRTDKYKQLEAEMETAPENSYDPNVKSKAAIKKEMEELLSERAGNVDKKVQDEVKAEKERRVQYLQTLINGGV